MATSLLHSTRLKLIFLGSWVGWSLLQIGLLWWLDLDWNTALIDSLVSNTLLMAASALISNNLQFYQPEKGRYAYVAIWCLILSAIYVFAGQWIVGYLEPQKTAYLDFFYKSLPVRFSFGFLMIGWVALLSIIWYTRQDQREAEKRKADAERLSREAELYKLRQQLQPHFLFNSLNSISALVGRKPEEARTMVHQLSDFLRGTLRKEENEWVTLAEELQHLQLYLDIEKVRFGHRLTTEISQGEGCGDLKLPAMLLQPLVENAIKFGLYDTTGLVIISINACCEDNYLVLTIQNPYDPNTSNPRRGTGFGLSGVKRRLYLLFARHDLLQTSGETNIFTTSVKIPQV
ncbi:sensor histidine kinase [Pedobacter sp. HMF7647]|uniref:Sensor histidine kinase n=1 Tax=Hufsiella arboris TaxID=2695275 RepID=A0A7K1Y949_9SPHI|nr:histidine kinase [Hufsiella arboris]MXV51116.1 sensor histidine kinase [Hufsiella arboris]